MAGNGTIGLEIVEDLPDVETVLVPFGGGGSAAGSPRRCARWLPAARSTPARSRPPLRWPPLSRQASRWRSTTSRASSTGSAARPSSPEMFAARPRAPRGLARRRARRGCSRGPPARGAEPGRRGGRRRGARRGSAESGTGKDRLRRLRREHRHGDATRDPRRVGRPARGGGRRTKPSISRRSSACSGVIGSRRALALGRLLSASLDLEPRACRPAAASERR